MGLGKNELNRLTSLGAWDVISKDGELVKACDGPHGLRFVISEENGYQKDEPSYAYPTLSCLSNTWNEDVVYKIGKCIGEDCKKHDVSLILAPGVNIKRTPLCGRNFEYFSEDPYLSGTMGKSYISGVQSTGVGACLKHFACNNREYDRFFQSSEVDERTLREIYLKPFEIALEAKPYALMCAYNPVNGVLMSENSYLLKDVLRDSFKYDGLVISDWGSVRDRAKSLKAGIDVAFPYNSDFLTQLEKGLEFKYITEDDVNSSLNRVDEFVKKSLEGKKIPNKEDLSYHHEVAVEACLEGIVLLKNDGILPLNRKENVLLVGEFLANPVITGGGSSKVTPIVKPLSLLDALKERDDSKNYSYAQAYMMRYELPTPFNYKYALECASKNDVVIVGVGNTMLEEKEETDRESIKLKFCFEDLIKKLTRVNKNVIVVLYCGSAVDVSAFEKDVRAIILANYGGEGVNEALSDILLGRVSPSGRLSESWPMCLEDTYCKSEVGDSFKETYNEGVLVGYRYYLNKDIKTRYPFGYGLSYIDVSYSSLRVNKEGDEYIVKVDVKNNSSISGKEVVELYISDVSSSVERPLRELKRFKKVMLLPNSTVEVEFRLKEEDFMFYSSSLHSYYLENGLFKVEICKDAETVLLSEDVEIERDYYSQYTRF